VCDLAGRAVEAALERDAAVALYTQKGNTAAASSVAHHSAAVASADNTRRPRC